MPKNAKILFFGFGEVGYRCLKHLLENDFNVAAVFTHDFDQHEKSWFTSPEKIARENFVEVYKPASLKTQKWIRKVAYMRPDLILSLYYRNRIPEEMLKCARLGAYNMHGSYLPSYRGRAPLNWAIINGENYTGVSLHEMQKDFDTGDIVARKKIPFTDDEYVSDIQPRVAQAAEEIFKQALPALVSGTAQKTPQSALEGAPSYFGKRTPEDGRINFAASARQIRNLVRAVSRPFNGAFFEREGKRYVVWRADIAQANGGRAAGEIVQLNNSELVFAAKDALLRSTDFEVI